MTNLPNLSHIGKNITIADFSLTKQGMWISYTAGEKEQDLIANPEQTCDILKKADLIKDYSGAGDDVCVEHDMEYTSSDNQGEPVESTKLMKSEWNDFILTGFELQKKDVLDIIIMVEKEKAIAAAVGKNNVEEVI